MKKLKTGLKNLDTCDWIIIAVTGLLTFGSALLLSGCNTVGSNPKAPTKLESYLFNTVTNTVTVTNNVPVPVPVYATNVVNVTNPVTQIVTSNLVSVIDHWYTNTIQVPTNVPAYSNSVSDATKNAVQGAGSIINTFIPGVGGMISSGVLAILGIWAGLRSSKMTNTSTALIQEIETIRNFVQTLPNGATYDAALLNFLSKHQAEANVVQQVADLLANKLKNPDAQVAAQQIAETITALGAQTPTTPPATPPKVG